MNNHLTNRPPWDLNALPPLIYEPTQTKRREFYDLAAGMQSYFRGGNTISTSTYIGLLNALILLLNEVSLVGGVLDYCSRKSPSDYGERDDNQQGLKESLILLRNELRDIKKADSEARSWQTSVRCGHPDLTWGRFNPDPALRLLQMIARHGIDETVRRKLDDTANKKGLIGSLYQKLLNPSDIVLEDKTSNDIWVSAMFCFGELIDEYNQGKTTDNTIFDDESRLSENTHSIEEIRRNRDLRNKLRITKEIEIARYNAFITSKSFKNFQTEYYVRGEFPTEKDFWQNRNPLHPEIASFDDQNKDFVECLSAAIKMTGDEIEVILLAGLHWFLVTNDISFDRDYTVWRQIKAEKIIEYARAYKSPDSTSETIEWKPNLIQVENEWKNLCRKLGSLIIIYEDFKTLNPRFMELKLTDQGQ